MRSKVALCRVQLKPSPQGSKHFRTLENNLTTSPTTRLLWLQQLARQYQSAAEVDGHDIRDWDFVLDLDGSVENVAGGQASCASRQQTTPSAATTPARRYAAHYRAPESVINRFPPGTDRIRRMESFAIGSLMYELCTGKKPFYDRDEHEIQRLYTKGDFPDDVWSLPCAVGILCCWCPEFAREIREPPLDRLSRYVKEHPISFSCQLLGGMISVASIAAVPVLGAIGFAAAGPVAGSAAAAWQASIGLVEAGSVFAFCQSAAMGGAAVGGITATGVSGLTLAAGATAVQALESKEPGIPAAVLKEKFLYVWRR